MKTIVTNTGPLIALAGIERLDILPALFDEIWVPQQVRQEILQGKPGSLDIAAYQRASHLRVSGPIQIDPLLASLLDQGEAAVIQLARAEKISHVLIDERQGRKVAREIYGLSVLGTARVLVEAKRAGLLDNVGEALETMRAIGYRIHDNIVQVARREAGEL